MLRINVENNKISIREFTSLTNIYTNIFAQNNEVDLISKFFMHNRKIDRIDMYGSIGAYFEILLIRYVGRYIEWCSSEVSKYPHWTNII